ncbi:MAG: glycosyltransferase family 39 protein [Acidobacteria bacterium]|nr:glycosyltransferase family 39 protein [Acidobacteriota bacterium]
MSLAGLVLLQLGTLVLFALPVLALGRALLLGRPDPRGTAPALAFALGLGAAGSLLLVAAGFGGLRRELVLATVAAGSIAFVAIARRGSLAPPRAWTGAFLFCLAALIPAWVWGLYPPTAFDATVYHLPFAKAFAEAHRLVVVPDLIYPIFPQLAETLFAATMVAAGTDTVANLIQWSAALAVALLLFETASRLYSRRAGLLASALWLAHPLVHYQAASAYVDVVLACFALAAICCWERWHEEGSWRWLALSGAAAGFAMATKYLGLLWAALLVATTLFAARRGRRWRGALLLSLVAALVAAPWYLRIYSATGNPVHPLLAPLFGGERAAEVAPELGLDEADSTTGMAAAVLRRVGEVVRRPQELALFAWRAAFVPEAFNRQAPLAPWPMLLAPVAALFAWRDRRLLRWLLLVGAYAAFWTTLQPRFQLPGAALLALAGAGGVEHLARRFGALGRAWQRRGAAMLLAVAVVAPGPLYAVYKIGKLGAPPPTDPSAREDFLDRKVPCHAAVRFSNERPGAAPTLFAVGAPELTYYARGRFLGHVLGPHRAGRIVPYLGDPEALHRELRSMDVDELLIPVGFRSSLLRGAELDRLFRPLYADARCELFEVSD